MPRFCSWSRISKNCSSLPLYYLSSSRLPAICFLLYPDVPSHSSLSSDYLAFSECQVGGILPPTALLILTTRAPSSSINSSSSLRPSSSNQVTRGERQARLPLALVTAPLAQVVTTAPARQGASHRAEASRGTAHSSTSRMRSKGVETQRSSRPSGSSSSSSRSSSSRTQL